MNEIIQAFQIALNTILDPVNFAIIVLVVLLGFIMGVIPGLGGTVTLALLIPLTFGMEPIVAFMIFAAALGATNFGGSITSILINTPGSAVNAATLLDGYPMTRNGEAGIAIGASAMASASGAIFGILILIAGIPVLREIVVLFGPPEVFWLGIWGLTVIAIVVRGDVLAGLIAASFGVMFALHGLNTMTTNIRWTYGFTFLIDGFKLIPALIGLFAVTEMISLVGEGGSIAQDSNDSIDNTTVGSDRWKGVKAVIEHKYLFLRSAVIGAVIGMIPGVGGTTANYVAYFQAVQTSSDSEKFGTGDVRGVIASEASNDAKDGTGFLPTLGLGIPGSASMAVLLGAFILHGLTPGPLLMEDNLEIVAITVVALLISNILSSVIGFSLVNKLTYITKIDVRIIAPVVLAVAFFGTYALNSNVYDIFVALGFGLLGYMMMKVEMSRVPMVLALVLGPIIEQNFFRTLQISRNEYSIFFSSNVSIILIILTVITLFIPIIKPRVKSYYQPTGGNNNEK